MSDTHPAAFAPCVLLLLLRPPSSTLFPYTTLFRSVVDADARARHERHHRLVLEVGPALAGVLGAQQQAVLHLVQLVADRKSTRLNSSHVEISYAVFCLKKKSTQADRRDGRAALRSV